MDSIRKEKNYRLNYDYKFSDLQAVIFTKTRHTSKRSGVGFSLFAFLQWDGINEIMNFNLGMLSLK